MDYSYLDIVVVILIAILGLKGLIQGFVKEVTGLLGIVGGVFVGSRFSAEAGTTIMEYAPFIESPSGGKLAGFAVVFLLFWVSMLAFGTVIKKLLKLSGLGFFDRVAGAITGGAKIFFIFAIVAYALGSVDFISKKLEPKMANSFMYPLLFDTGSYIMKMDSGKTMDKVNQVRDNVSNEVKSMAEEAIDDAIKSAPETENLTDEQINTIKDKAKELTPQDLNKLLDKQKDEGSL